MINLNILKNVKRAREEDKRNFKTGIRSDRNEKVENWSPNIFKRIFNKIASHEFTAYYNTTNLHKLELKIARFYKIKIENIVINHGGDGVIKEFLLVNYQKGMKVLINGNNYGMYYVYFKGLNIKPFEIQYKFSLNDKNLFNLDKKYLEKNIKKYHIFFFTNPSVVSNSDLNIRYISKLCSKYPKKLFFIDESYNGFGQTSFIKLIKKHKNIFIMRSITKSFGLASARVGFLIAHKDSIKPFKALQTPYPLSLFSGKCLEFFIENKKIIKSYNYGVLKGRKFFSNELRKKNYLINDGQGLSVLIYFKSKSRLMLKYKKLLKKNIYTKIINVNSKYFIRVTCGPIGIMRRIIKFF